MHSLVLQHKELNDTIWKLRDCIRTLDQHKEFNDTIWKLRDCISTLESQLEITKKQLTQLQQTCNHTPELYRVGRHGSEKGDQFYRCTTCNFDWIE